MQNPTIHPVVNWAFRWVPGHALAAVQSMIERSFGQFYMTPSGDRRCTKQKVGSGVEKTPQREYSELLKPSYKVSCKRQVYDPGYLRLPGVPAQGESAPHG